MVQSEFRKKFMEDANARDSRLILALDVEDWEKAKGVLKKASKYIAAVKVHPEHPNIWGFEHEKAVEKIKKITKGLPVILDAKLADIDKSNATKTRFYLSKGYDAIICHGFSGEKAVEAVVKAADEFGKGVFILTAMTSPGHMFTPDKVRALSEIAKKLDIAGVVAPGNQYDLLASVRSRIGEDKIIISPGIGAQGGDAEKAISAGTDFAIVGRSIVESEEPRASAKQERDAINKVLEKARAPPSINSELISLLIEKEVLRFGDFTLKSGRKSTYFFNAGNLDDGKALDIIGEAYASVVAGIMKERKIDVIFGPAYKGIPLAVCAAQSLYGRHGITSRVVYDRKEAKEYGDLKDTLMVGNLRDGDNIVMVDDVITTGATKLDALEKLKQAGVNAKVTDLVVLFNRQETDKEGKNPVDGIEQAGIRVHCILNARETFEYLHSAGIVKDELYANFKKHQQEYGVK